MTSTLAPAPPPDVLTGIDVLARDGFRVLQGCRVGLITNQTGVARDGTSTVALLQKAPGVNLVALFSPEHGFEGKLDQANITDGRDPASGLPIHSLYGKTYKPTAESLAGIDTLVFDIQDVGARFYTYVTTMGVAMEAAAEHRLRFVVLDRPNPINGVDVSGPVLDAGRESLVAFHRIPVRHGMTLGELARLFNAERKIGAKLQVVPIEGWRRRDFFDATGLVWINPSPNMRSLTEAILYPGICLLETTNLSVGRGTDRPFEIIGAPWLDGRRLAWELNHAGLPGVRFVPIEFTPSSSKHKGKRCGGIDIMITDRQSFQSIRTGLEIACQLRKLHPKDWDALGYGRLLGNQQSLDALLAGKSAKEIEALAEPEVAKFRERRRQFLLYE
ncbi:MAG: exo-beta-N-acetylmuramidase NamZ family protein [Pirellulales bacterium]